MKFGGVIFVLMLIALMGGQCSGCRRDEYRCRRFDEAKSCIPKSWKCDYDGDCVGAPDEAGCSERCETRYTTLNDDGYGQLYYLDRHHPQCPKGQVMQMFHVQHLNYKIRYAYKCCKLLRAFCHNRQVIHTPFTKQGWPYRPDLLTRQTIRCASRSMLTSFVMQRNHDHTKIRYRYGCCSYVDNVVRRYLSCHSRVTNWTRKGSGKFHLRKRASDLQYLKVDCNSRWFLQGFKLESRRGRFPPEREMRYRYWCCRIFPKTHQNGK